MRYILITAIFGLAACGGVSEPAQEADAGETACPPGITIVDSWTKPARAGQPVSAAYLTICNGDDTDDALVAVANGPDDTAETIEVHLSAMTDGVMSMKKVERIALPAGERTVFEPGGAHIMLLGVTRDVASGGEPTLRLEFENAEDIDRAFEVREEQGNAHEGHH